MDQQQTIPPPTVSTMQLEARIRFLESQVAALQAAVEQLLSQQPSPPELRRAELPTIAVGDIPADPPDLWDLPGNVLRFDGHYRAELNREMTFYLP